MRRVVSVGAALLSCACMTEETVQVKSGGTQPLGIAQGQVLPNPPPEAQVVLQERGGKLELFAAWVGICNRTERGVSRRVQTTKTRVTTTGTAIAAIIGGAGMAMYMWPDLDAQSSLTGGTILFALGGIPYLIGAAQVGETTEELPPVEVERPAGFGPCTVAPVSREAVVVTGADTTLEGQTDAQGHIRFDGTVAAPAQVSVRGRRVEKVEWRK